MPDYDKEAQLLVECGRVGTRSVWRWMVRELVFWAKDEGVCLFVHLTRADESSHARKEYH